MPFRGARRDKTANRYLHTSDVVGEGMGFVVASAELSTYAVKVRKYTVRPWIGIRLANTASSKFALNRDGFAFIFFFFERLWCQIIF